MRIQRTIVTLAAVALTALGMVQAAGSPAFADPGTDVEFEADGERGEPLTPEPVDASAVGLTDRAYFNDPLKTPVQQFAIRDHIQSLIKNAAAGSTISVAVYNIHDATVSDALVEAHNRSVNVRVIVDSQSATWPAVDILRDGLGTNRTARSWLVVCTTQRACIGNLGSPIMHNKFYLFSSTSGSRNVVVQSSANQNVSNSTKFYNNALQLVGNTGLYNAYLGYFADLAAQRKDNNYYATHVSGNAKVYFFPRSGTDKNTDTIYNALNENVSCEGSTTAGTRTGRTIIRVAMWSFTRQGIADELRQLADQKCLIYVIYTESDAGVIKALKGHPRIHLYQLKTLNADGTERTIVHSKYMAIEGKYAGKANTRLVFTGSHNYTNSALRENDEAMIKITSDPIHDAYWHNFVTMRGHATLIK